MTTARARFRGIAAAYLANLRSRNLRQAQMSFGAAWTSEWALTVGIAIVAFQDGGAAAVGLVTLLRLAPAAIAGPYLATIADRIRRERVIAAIGVVRTVSVGGMAVLLAVGTPMAPVYALVVVATIAGTPLRAAHSALLPSLCTTPEQLASANAVRGMLDSLATLVGPLVAAVLLALGTPATVFAAAAIASAWSALLILRLDYEIAPRTTEASHTSVLGDMREGLAAFVAHRDLAALLSYGVSQTFTRGCLNVFVVVMAIDLLAMGESGAGVLTAAVGAGAVIGSLAATLLVGSRRLATWYGVSVALWGLPLVFIGIVPEVGAALVLLAVIGLANAVLDVSGFSVVPRMAPDEVLARVWGIFEAMVAATVALGSILTPLVIDAVGVQGALIALGSVCPALTVLCWARLRKIDRSLQALEEDLDHLREVPMLQPLPITAMDDLGRHLGRTRVPAGQAVFAQGDQGDRFYVIAAGEAEVIGDGEHICTLGRDDSFGEIALLRDVPRTTEVRARTELELYALDRDDVVNVVKGYGPAAAAADTVITRLIGAVRPGTAGA